ncbi:hypothetical protein PoB_006374600 [Plakobranchus ocellatus]|uniref:DUF6729 domain-containing protein n=1 Tax=Plakobranchus ocellatus TaxID=259542 RepID=A0AAV4CZ69_9GAST|nr:hypothetical protein PoB_006374600 [Plakobranchus ocellatus]
MDPRLRGNPVVVMGETTLEFGMYQGQTFRWALENATGWVVALVASEVAETLQTSNIGIHQGPLMQYASHFPKVQEQVDFRKALNASVAKVKATGDVDFGQSRSLSWRDLVLSKSKDHKSYCSFLVKKAVDPTSTMGQLQSYLKAVRLLKAVTRQTPASSAERLLSLKEMVPTDEDELALVQLTKEVEAKEVVAADTTTARPTSGELQTKSFTESAAPECRRQQLASCGLYKTVRRVIDLSVDYYMGAEYLECGKCHKKLPSWSMDILGQLDPAHRSSFPAVLTYHFALDKRVVAFLKDRSLGNSSTQLAASFRRTTHMTTWRGSCGENL